ncbi:MAG: hypothetical protein HZB19_16035 [Chloroflexi bacterium]|nr:hypothetical protein [Chloroflexota bacterium]
MALFNISTTLPVFGSGVADGVMGVGVHMVAVRVWIIAVISGGVISPDEGTQAMKKIKGTKGNKRFSIYDLPGYFVYLYTIAESPVNDVSHTIVILLADED